MRFTRDTMELPEVLPAGVRASVSMARWAPFFLCLIVGYGFMQHGYAKIARNRALCRNPGGDRRSGASDHELADDLRRGRRRPCGSARGLRTRRDSADGGNTSRRYFDRPSSERLQLDQASECYALRSSLWPTRLRDRPPLSQLPAGPGAWRARGAVRRGVATPRSGREASWCPDLAGA